MQKSGFSKKLPMRSIIFSYHPAFSKKHKGEFFVREQRACFNELIIWNHGKPKFFKTKAEALAYILDHLENDAWTA